MGDLISRQAAFDNAWQVMYKDEWHMTQTGQVVIVNDIEALPTIDPVKRGKWEYIGGYGYQYRCSNCSMCAEHKTPYCPHCGARMDGEE